jgi:ABC-type sugar transport system ATPase subunit
MALAGGGSAQCQALLSDSALNQPVTVGIRPEALTPATEASATISGRVQLVEELGEFHLIYITTAGGDTVIAKVEGTAAVKADDTIHLMAPLEKIHLFDEQGRSLQV